MNKSIPSSKTVRQPKRTIALFNHELTDEGDEVNGRVSLLVLVSPPGACLWLILLKKSVLPGYPILTAENALLAPR